MGVGLEADHPRRSEPDRQDSLCRHPHPLGLPVQDRCADLRHGGVVLPTVPVVPPRADPAAGVPRAERLPAAHQGVASGAGRPVHAGPREQRPREGMQGRDLLRRSGVLERGHLPVPDHRRQGQCAPGLPRIRHQRGRGSLRGSPEGRRHGDADDASHLDRWAAAHGVHPERDERLLRLRGGHPQVRGPARGQGVGGPRRDERGLLVGHHR